MTSRARRCALAASLGAWILLGSATSIAQQGKSAAALYDQGASAFAAGRYAEAAEAFRGAYELAENPVALESAIKAATLAGDAPLALSLSEDASKFPDNADLQAAAKEARTKLAGKAGRLQVQCPPAPSGLGRLACVIRHAPDAEPMPLEKPIWMTAGTAGLTVEVADRKAVHQVDVPADTLTLWEAPPPATDVPKTPPPAIPESEPPPEPKEPEESSGASPAWFWAGLGLTAATGIGTGVAGGVTLSKHSDFEGGDDSAVGPGQDAQLATNILLGVTGVLAVTTVLVGTLAVDWGGTDEQGSRAPRRQLALTPVGITGTW